MIFVVVMVEPIIYPMALRSSLPPEDDAFTATRRGSDGVPQSTDLDPIAAAVTAALATPPDAHGQAALLLVESVLHALVERGLLSAPEARAAVQVAVDVKRDIALDNGETEGVRDESLRLLTAIAQSLAAYGDLQP